MPPISTTPVADAAAEDADNITIDVPLTARDLQVISKSLSITLDVVASKALRCTAGSNRRRTLEAEFKSVDDALINIREAQATVFGG
jgi:hypothetical protein